jgi:MoxR-like ATPase
MNLKLLKESGLFQTSPTESSSYVFTDNPNENVDYDRLLDGSTDCYREPAQARELKKKKIIITDPFMNYGLTTSWFDIRQYLVLFAELLDEGFELFAWTGELTPITSRAEIHSALKRIQPVHHAELNKILAENGMGSDECYLAGVGQTNSLITTFIAEFHEQYLDAPTLYETLPPTILENILDCIPPHPVVGLSFGSDLSLLTNEIFRKYLIRHPAISLSPSNITWNKVAELCKEYPALEALDLGGCEQLCDFPDDLTLSSTLKKLVFHTTNIAWNSLAKICKQCPALETLELSICKQLGDLPDDLTLPPTLKKLDLEDTNTTWKDIEKISRQCQALESLNLSDCKQLGALPDNLVLPSTLKKLDLSNIKDITWEDIEKISRQCPALESLILKGCYDLYTIPNNLTLPSTLKKLDLSYIDYISWKGIKKISRQCPALESLILKDCDGLGLMLNDPVLPPNLKNLDLTKIKFTSEEINKISRQCPALESLTLHYIELHNTLHAELMLPPNLKAFGNNGLTSTRIKKISGQCRKLMQLTLGYIGVHAQDLIDEKILPANLLYLDIKAQKPSRDVLEQLQKTYPHILFSISQKAEANPDFTTTPSAEPLKLDDNTSGAADLNTQQVFRYKTGKFPHTNHYRLDVCTDITMDPKCIALNDRHEEIHLIDANIKSSAAEVVRDYDHEKPDIFLGHYKIPAGKQGWIALPSLSTEDKLLEISTHPACQFEVGYCKEKALYYFRPTSALTKPITVSYLIQADIDKPSKIRKPLAPDLVQLIQGLQFTQAGILEENEAKIRFSALSKEMQRQALVTYFNLHCSQKPIKNRGINDIDLINAIIKEGAGVCRHYTLAFMALAKALDLPARAVRNNTHAFVEVKHGHEWRMSDLGGGTANVTVEPMASIPVTEPEIKLSAGIMPKSVLDDDKLFHTWDSVHIEAENMGEYVERFIEHEKFLKPGSKNLLCVLDRKQMQPFHDALFQQKKSSCFYLPDLNNIADKSTVIDNASGKYHRDDSALKKFLQHAKAGDILLVNWTDYESIHVGYNSMMDEVRTLKGMPIPEGVTVMGLLERTQEMGEDFYSRFRAISDAPSHLPLVSKIIPAPKKPLSEAPLIRFYDDDWKTKLTGKISAANGRYQFTSSDFFTAIKNGEKKIILKNAPWTLPEFHLFITEMLSKGDITANGETIRLPADFEILRDDTPYSLSRGEYSIEACTTDTALERARILNIMTYSSLFQQSQSANHMLNTLNGYIAESAGSTLQLLVTENLSSLQWANIIETADHHHVSLHFVTAPGIILPNEMFEYAKAEKNKTSERVRANQNRIIESNDADFAAAQLSADALVLPINEKTTYADLTGTFKIDRTKEPFTFDYIEGALTTALLAGKHVILKGNLSAALAQQLETLFLPQPFIQTNGQHLQPIAGRLTIISNKNPGLDFAVHDNLSFTEEEKWTALKNTVDAKMVEQLKTVCTSFQEEAFSWLELKSMLKVMQEKPGSNPLKSLLRAKPNYLALKEKMDAAWLPFAAKKIKSKSREEKLERMLAKNWYVFVAGSSGIGKSTTINHFIRKMGYDVVKSSGSLNDKLLEWLTPGTRKALFLDEVNTLSSDELDVLEGLYENPPALLINGVLHPVPPENRLFFAGNFGHFKGRQQSRFISRHGNIIEFKEFTDAFLKENIIHPLSNSLFINEHERSEMMNIFLAAYHHINEEYPDKHPLTARNLQMMVMRYSQFREKMPERQARMMAVYDEASGVLNQSERRQLSRWLKSEYDIDVRELKKILKQDAAANTGKFARIKKRINPVRVLDNLFAIREKKITSANSHAGSNGILLEGNSGIGKSYLLLEYLREKGFEDGDVVTREAAKSPEKRYYHIRTREVDEVKAILRKAFHEGAVVIIDEVNTLAIEGTLNAYLSGTTPEGEPAQHAGFFFAGSGNPASFGKRHVLSDALLNRFQKVDLKDYGRNDLMCIADMLQGGEASSVKTAKMVDRFLNAQQYARENRIARKPTPRDLFERVRMGK